MHYATGFIGFLFINPYCFLYHKLITGIGLGNNSINRQYREPMMRNNQYRRFFEEAIITHLQLYRSVLQYIAVIYNTYTGYHKCNVAQHE